MRKVLLVLGLLAIAGPAAAQITPTYTFVNGTVINADEVNANFALLTNALNRTGGTMTGTLTTRAIAADGNGTRDIGASGTRFATIFSTTVNTTGITCASCSIADAWTFTANPLLSSTAPFLSLKETDQGADLKAWEVGVSGGTLNINTTTDALSTTSTRLTLSRTGGATFTSSVAERGRSFAMGATQTRAFNAGDFVGVGGGSVTVASGDVGTFTYRAVGDTLFVNVTLATFTVAGTVSNLTIAIPGGFTAAETTSVVVQINNNGTLQFGVASVSNGGSVINVVPISAGAIANWAAATDASGLTVQMAFKVS